MHQEFPFMKQQVPSTGRRACVQLTPRPSVGQRWMAGLFLQGLSAIVRHAGSPDATIARLVHLNRKLGGMHTRYQKCGGLIWPYLEGGRGDPVVLLHGYGADKDGFSSLVPFLRRSFRVIVPDLPGFGDHPHDRSLTYGIDHQAERLEVFLQAADVPRCHLLGISLGGYLAARYAAGFPQRVRSLTLVDSAGFSSPVPSEAMRLMASRGRNIFLYRNEEEMAELYRYLLHRPLKLPAAVRRYWTSQGLAQRAWRQKLFDDLIAGGIDTMDGLAHRIQAPTLVVWGAQDRICHVSAVDGILAKIANSRAYIIQACGHIPIIEYPMLFRKIYLGFLHQVVAEASPGEGDSRIR
jgi:pimeloyl-ACP methyl ester carboxylesterase